MKNSPATADRQSKLHSSLLNYARPSIFEKGTHADQWPRAIRARRNAQLWERMTNFYYIHFIRENGIRK